MITEILIAKKKPQDLERKITNLLTDFNIFEIQVIIRMIEDTK